jgi:hypothetical protein
MRLAAGLILLCILGGACYVAVKSAQQTRQDLTGGPGAQPPRAEPPPKLYQPPLPASVTPRK